MNCAALFRANARRAGTSSGSAALFFASSPYIPKHEPPNHHVDITPTTRCRLSDSSTKCGNISFVGPIPSLPGPTGAPWVGITLDEPVGKNDGSVPSGERYFRCGKNRGVFVRAERVEVGDFPELGLEDEGSDMEEI